MASIAVVSSSRWGQAVVVGDEREFSLRLGGFADGAAFNISRGQKQGHGSS